MEQIEVGSISFWHTVPIEALVSFPYASAADPCGAAS